MAWCFPTRWAMTGTFLQDGEPVLARPVPWPKSYQDGPNPTGSSYRIPREGMTGQGSLAHHNPSPMEFPCQLRLCFHQGSLRERFSSRLLCVDLIGTFNSITVVAFLMRLTGCTYRKLNVTYTNSRRGCHLYPHQGATGHLGRRSNSPSPPRTRRSHYNYIDRHCNSISSSLALVY